VPVVRLALVAQAAQAALQGWVAQAARAVSEA